MITPDTPITLTLTYSKLKRNYTKKTTVKDREKEHLILAAKANAEDGYDETRTQYHH